MHLDLIRVNDSKDTQVEIQATGNHHKHISRLTNGIVIETRFESKEEPFQDLEANKAVWSNKGKPAIGKSE